MTKSVTPSDYPQHPSKPSKAVLRGGIHRFVGDPFWYHGHYLVRTFRGRSIDLVEVNPYTGGYIGRVIS